MQRLLFPHPQSHRRQFLHLSALTQQHRQLVSERGLALRTDPWTLLHDLIGHSHQMQRLPAIPQLPAGLLATRLAQTLRSSLQPIARGRLGARVAVLGQSCLQIPHLRRQPPAASASICARTSGSSLTCARSAAFSAWRAAISSLGVMLQCYSCSASPPDLLHRIISRLEVSLLSKTDVRLRIAQRFTLAADGSARTDSHGFVVEDLQGPRGRIKERLYRCLFSHSGEKPATRTWAIHPPLESTGFLALFCKTSSIRV